MRKRATQQEAIFYRLYKLWKARDLKYLPVHELMGEVFIEELGKWGYVSYECSARASEMFSANPGLLQRQQIVGRSGAKYYGYRLNPRPEMSMLKDPSIKLFHGKLSARGRAAAAKMAASMRSPSVRDPNPYAEHNREMEKAFGPFPPKP